LHGNYQKVTVQKEFYMISEKIIQQALFKFYNRLNHKLIVPNIYLHYSEADLITVQASGYVNEIEIKLTKADFKRDFKKKKHRYMHEAKNHVNLNYPRLHTPNYFWFCIPKTLLPKIDCDIPDDYGMILMDENGIYPEIYKRAKIMHRQKVTDKQVRQIARSLMFKMWSVRE
jgi:hypothetical protein